MGGEGLFLWDFEVAAFGVPLGLLEILVGIDEDVAGGIEGDGEAGEALFDAALEWFAFGVEDGIVAVQMMRVGSFMSRTR